VASATQVRSPTTYRVARFLIAERKGLAANGAPLKRLDGPVQPTLAGVHLIGQESLRGSNRRRWVTSRSVM
jgi:hypothetical protein